MTRPEQQAACHIVCAGPGSPDPARIAAGDYVMAADGGYASCLEAGIAVDLVVGDFDSLDASVQVEGSTRKTVLPCDKDDTDTLACVRRGLEMGFARFVLHCALGADLGHTLANIQTLLMVRKRGAQALLLGGGQEVFTVVPEDGACSIEAEPGTRVSVLAVGGIATGVCERGLHWELDDAQLEPTFPLGVSNQVAAPGATVSVGSGTLLVVVG